MPWRAHIYLRHVLYSTVQHSTYCNTQPTWASLHLVCNYANLISRLLEIATCVTDTDVTEFRTRLMACHLVLRLATLLRRPLLSDPCPCSSSPLRPGWPPPSGPRSRYPQSAPRLHCRDRSPIPGPVPTPSWPQPLQSPLVQTPLPLGCRGPVMPWASPGLSRRVTQLSCSHRTAISGGLGATRRRCRRLVKLSPVFPAHLAAGRSPHRGDDPGLVVTFGDLLSR